MTVHSFAFSSFICTGIKRGWRSGLRGVLLACVTALTLPAWAQNADPVVINAKPPERRWLSVGVGSQHLSNASQYNQSNPGLGIEWPMRTAWLPEIDTRLAVGFFNNSESARSIYAGGFVFPWHYREGQIKLGALVGVIDGYKRANNGGFFPLLVPTVAFESQRWGANVFLVPPVAGIPSTLALQVKVAF